MKTNNDSLISTACEIELANRMHKYEKVAEGFAQFFNQEEIGAIIDRKADLELVRRIQDTKASK
jgi:hypothetical protein